MERILLLAAMLILVLSSVAEAQPSGGRPVGVIVANVDRKPIVDEVEALGTLRANESVDITSTVTELVTGVYFEDGQRVAQGDLLVEMDSAEERAELLEEQSRLEEAKRQLERAKPLVAQEVTSEATLDLREREVNTARARIKAIESRIAKRRVTAPFDGVLGLRNISVGALAQPGTLVTTIDDDSIMKLDFSVPAVYLPTLEPGIRITARSRAFPEKLFEGEISSVDSRIDPVTRAVTVRALIDNEDRLLKPGLLMRVVLQKNPREALIVPEEALIPDGNRNFGLVVVDGEKGKTVERREVELGQRQTGEAEILSGLEEGEQVVTHGAIKARPGAPVNIKSVQEGDEPLPDLLGRESGADE